MSNNQRDDFASRICLSDASQGIGIQEWSFMMIHMVEKNRTNIAV
jgi:hypothetical protein